jgi:drug/metabolite transporter (DMT)-like permease
MAAPSSHAAFRIAPRRSVLALFLVVALGNAWSLQYSSAKFIGETGLPPFGSLFTVHVFLAAAFVAVLSVRCELFIPTLGELKFFCLAGFLGNIFTLGIELAAAAHISAGLVTLILSMAPVFTVVIAWLMRTEKVGLREAGSLALGAIAAGAILLPQVGFARNPMFWLVICFAAPAGFGLYTVLLAARWPRRLNTIQVATGIAVAAMIMLAPMAGTEGELFLLDGRLGPSDLALAAFGLTMGAEYYLLTLITRLSGAIFASCADFIAIAMGLFWGFAFFNEVPEIWMCLAAGLCIAAVFLVNRTPAIIDPYRAGIPPAADPPRPSWSLMRRPSSSQSLL